MAAVHISVRKVWADPVPLSQISLFWFCLDQSCCKKPYRQKCLWPALSTVNEFENIKVLVLELQLHSPAQDKRAVVNILMDRAKCTALTTAQRQSEKRRVINGFKASGYPKNFIKSA